MNPRPDHTTPFPVGTTIPAPCPLFGACGGCQYQDIPYPDECRLKERQLAERLASLGVRPGVLEPIVPSPSVYHYRCRLDLKFLKTKSGDCFMGFSPVGRNRVMEASACPIALPAISGFLPELKKLATAGLPRKYRNANLVVKTGDDGRVFWGGIGRRSLRMAEADYLWTEVKGKRIFFSLDTFFQANLSILPLVIDRVIALCALDPGQALFDLYGGVGLFGVCLAGEVKDVFLIEENIHAARLALFNKDYHRADRFHVLTGRTEDLLLPLLAQDPGGRPTAFVDPPRSGLSDSVIRLLAAGQGVPKILYLSCDTDSLVRDLAVFQQHAWDIARIIPFDFFPRTRHLETLVYLRRV